MRHLQQSEWERFKNYHQQKKLWFEKCKKNWLEVTARKTTKSEAKELYNELIQKYVDAIERKKSNNTKKHNILKILNNVGTIFTGTYLHHKDVPKKTMFERSIAVRTKLRKEKVDEIKEKRTEHKQWIF